MVNQRNQLCSSKEILSVLFNYEIYGDCVQILLLEEEKYMRAGLGILIPVKE